MSAATGSLVSRIYKGFRGVDFRSDETNFARSPDSLNVWKDYKEVDSIRTRPGLRKVFDFDTPIKSLFYWSSWFFVHSRNYLYRVDKNDYTKRLVYSNMPLLGCVSFVFNDTFYIKGAGVYLMVDEQGSIKEVEGYVPTTSIGRKPSGGGSTHEDVNLLTGYRINTFLADGESKTFVLDAQNIDENYPPIVFVNDEEVTEGYTVNYEAGSLTFNDDTNAPSAPLTDGQDNVSIKFFKLPKKHNEFMLSDIVQVFDNRVFFACNARSMVWHSSLSNPAYFSDLDYYEEGVNDARIQGMVASNNALWVFTETSHGNTTVFYHTPAVDSEYGKVYPSVHSSITTGCRCKNGAINFNDDIVFLSYRGLEGISGDITTEQALAHRSSLVDRMLTGDILTPSLFLAEWEGYLFIFVGDNVYLADSRSKFTNVDHIEYEWFYWELEKRVTCVLVIEDGGMYLGTSDAVYTLGNYYGDVESYWVTPKDRFGAANKLKTTSKRGCVAEATGDVTVYAKVEDSEFEKIGEYKDVQDYFVSRIKRKKFKDIQLKFHSNTRFSLESATLEAWVGGYIKR